MSDDEGRAGLGGGGRRKNRGGFIQDDSDDDNFGGGLGFGKKRRGGDNDDNLLGVFASGGDDFGRKKKPKGGGKGGMDTQRLHTPVGFVKGKTMTPTEIPRKVEEKKTEKKEKKKPKKDGEASSSDDEIDSRFRLDGAPNAANLPKPVEGPKLPSRNKLGFGQMQETYGKGFLMMQKMGFKGGGLGRHEDGIANPIEVVLRSGRSGIQDEGERGDQDLYGNESAPKRTLEELLFGGDEKKTDEGAKPSENWKKGNDARAKKPKTQYKTAAELAAEPSSIRIVDMRGPEVRVATSFSELQASISGDGVKSLKELRHNTRLLVARYEDKVKSAAERKRHFEDVLLSAKKEEDRLKAADGLSDAEVASCKEIVIEIESLREQQDMGSVNLKDLCASFKRLRSTRPKEFRALHATEIAFALAAPTAKRDLATWRPLHKPEEGLSCFKPWRDFADSGGDHAQKLLTALLEATVLPKLRNAMSEWSPRDCDTCIRLVECLKKVVQKSTADSIAAEAILPRLMAEVESWDPRTDRMLPHLWLHPWLPVLGQNLEVLWTPVRFKISACLDRWDSSDHSALAMLKPWKDVFGPANWDPIIEKVLVRLERSISVMSIRPDGQDLQPIKDLLIWIDVAPIGGLARVLETGLFPMWHDALRKWLRTPGVEFNEVLQWYQGWKALLPAELREQPAVQKSLANGLEVMKYMMANGPDAEAPPPPGGSPDASPRASAPETGRPKVAAAEDVTLSLADYVTEVAAEEGLVFLPKKQLRNGKPTYQLGSVTIQLERNLILVSPPGGEGEWKPVGMDEALALAKKAPPKKKS
eukprot:TRINITY_DN250_c1_g3_i2.p1 TRINITY_DN250_c1_g3~~TRINITY_DN250_c1_g3_i2.p1  ORF type:complete len:814 (-),score=228.35 TRINITY_DN250_c1_g3_i2:214-2655(-)